MIGRVNWKDVVAKAIARGDARPPEHEMTAADVQRCIRRIVRQRHKERIKNEATAKDSVCALA